MCPDPMTRPDPAAWIRQLRDEQPSRRAEAARRLEELKARQAVEALREALKDPQPEVQVAAARALGEIGAVGAMDALIEALKSDALAVRLASAQALVWLGWRPPKGTWQNSEEFDQFLAEASAEELEEFALHLDDVPVQQAALEALERIETPEVIPPLLRLMAAEVHSEDEVSWWKSLALKSLFSESRVTEIMERIRNRFGEQVIVPLLPFLTHPKADVRWVAMRVLSELDDARLFEPFLVALRDEDSAVRRYAVRGLGKLGDARAVEGLKAALQQDENEAVRLAALDVLLCLAPVEIIEGAMRLLQNSSSKGRQAAAQALCSLDTPQVIPALLTLLEDKESEIRLLAIQAMRKFREPRATEALVHNLEYWDEEVRQAAAEALEALGWSPHDDAQRFWYAVACQDVEQIRALAQSSLEQVILLLGDKSPSRLEAVTEAVLALGEEVIEPLIAALQNQWLRLQAIRLLGQIRSPRAVPALLALLSQEERPPYREEILTALASIGASTGDSAAVQTLLLSLYDPNHEVAKTAARLLVAWYWMGTLPEEMRQAVLNRREEITYHHDRMGQNEFGCRKHEDEGLGVDFPL
ncbi:MAG: hypothetical protein Fur0043_23450 [Anaerolineales bacterium]